MKFNFFICFSKLLSHCLGFFSFYQGDLLHQNHRHLEKSFLFKDERKAEDELAKKKAAFLLKQQKKAQEARLRKQQLEAESELKREEARYLISPTSTAKSDVDLIKRVLKTSVLF